MDWLGGDATWSNRTDSKSVKMETGNEISEHGRVEISKNISSEGVTSWPSDRAYARYVSAATVFLCLRGYWRLVNGRNGCRRTIERTFRLDAVFENATVRFIRRYDGDRRFSGKMEKSVKAKKQRFRH